MSHGGKDAELKLSRRDRRHRKSRAGRSLKITHVEAEQNLHFLLLMQIISKYYEIRDPI